MCVRSTCTVILVYRQVSVVTVDLEKPVSGQVSKEVRMIVCNKHGAKLGEQMD